MSYATQSLLSNDQDFLNRCYSCAATQELPDGFDPMTWVNDHRWDLAATPGFDSAYESAIAGGIGRPGWEEAVISDQMILGGTQALLGV